MRDDDEDVEESVGKANEKGAAATGTGDEEAAFCVDSILATEFFSSYAGVDGSFVFVVVIVVADADDAAANANGDEGVGPNVNGCTTSCCCPNTNAGIGGALDADDDDGVKRVEEGKGGTAPAC